MVSRVGGWQEPEDEAERQKSKPARVITSLKYKYNSEGFIYDRRPHIFVVSADGGPPQQLTDGDFADADRMAAPLPLLRRGMRTATTITLPMCGSSQPLAASCAA